MILHTLNRSSFTFELSSAAAAMAPGDLLLLIEDGVYTALDNPTLSQLQAAGVSLKVLTEDAAARGIAARIPDAVECVDYDGFVALVCTTDKTVAWF